MRKLRYPLLAFCVSIMILIGQAAFGQQQVKIRGTVFDKTQKRPLEGVSVLSNKSGGTSTDVHGSYLILVDKDDSIYFSYQGKATMKFPVQTMIAANNFDISLQVKSDLLPEIFVRKRSYKEDSIQNRIDYAKVFDYSKPGLSVSAGGGGVGFDVNELIDIFRVRKKKNMLSFQRRLVAEEQDKYVDYRFNKRLVKELTGLDGAQLDMFMKMNRPNYYFVVGANQYDFYEYIKESAKKFKEVFKEEEKKNDIKTP
ncbi:MAG TPA: carboxypeptidase-like regulatory domain-containing protein [Chitinophagaceae bacterium]|nr:carboxypeptidase-like regulatory domain-containing protein [Chitinophagaceae bacterium]